MFKIHKQSQNLNIYKKSVQKLYDHKRDISRRIKYLKNIVENTTEKELQKFYDRHYSMAFYVLMENFLLIDTNVKLKLSNRTQKDELSLFFEIFESIVVHLPDLIHQRWQYHSFEFIISKLLHPKNTVKIRKEGLHLFLLWMRCLRENTLPQTYLLFECVVPGFTSNQPICSIDNIFKLPVYKSGPFSPIDIVCLVPSQRNYDAELKEDLSQYFFNGVLELMAVKVQALKWKDFEITTIKSFVFLWDLFVTNYLLKVFIDFSFTTSVYSPCLDLPEIKETSNQSAYSTSGVLLLDSTLTEFKVSVMKWIVAFTCSIERSKTTINRLPTEKDRDSFSHVTKQLQELEEEDRNGIVVEIKSPPNETSSESNSDQSIRLPDTYPSASNTSTLNGKIPSQSSVTGLDDKLQSCTSQDEWIIQSVLFSTKRNVNLIQELFRQTFMLPITEATIIKRVLKVYQHWIQDKEVPIFMQYPPPRKEMQSNGPSIFNDDCSSNVVNSTENFAQSTAEAIKAAQICAGPESTYQLFITNSAYVFLTPLPVDTLKLIRTQVDVCKRVLSLYRYMVVNVYLASETWIQLLRILLHIIKKLLDCAPMSKKGAPMQERTVPSRLAGPLFQTLIVSLIKANLSVPVSRDLWDETLEVLSSRCNWPELIEEWGRNLEIITRVFSRYVYNLEILDLPLDRLTEQKNKRQPKNLRDAAAKLAKESLYEQAFRRAVGRRSISFICDFSSSGNRKRSFAYPAVGLDSYHDVSSSNSQMSNHRNLSFLSPISPIPSSDLSPRKGTSDPRFTSSSSSGSNRLKRYSSASEIPDKSSMMIDGNSSRLQMSNQSVRSGASPENLATPSKGSMPQLAWVMPLYEYYDNPKSPPSTSNSPQTQQQDKILNFPESIKQRDFDANDRDFPRDETDEFAFFASRRLVKDPYPKANNLNPETVSIASSPSSTMESDWLFWEEQLPPKTAAGIINSSPKPGYNDGFRILASQTLESRDNAVSLVDISAVLRKQENSGRSPIQLLTSTSDRAITYYLCDESEDGPTTTVTDFQLSHSSATDVYSVREAPSALTSDVEAILPEIPEEDEDLEFAFHRSRKQKSASLKQDKDGGSPAVTNAPDNTNNCGTLAGGSQTGWSAPVAVVMWRRLLGILGDVNQIRDPANHSAAFQHLLRLWEVLFKMKQNFGVSVEGESPSISQELVPPLNILSPWAFEATMNLPDSYRDGRLQALQLLCKATLQREHDPPLEVEHLAQFYASLHEALHSQDQDVVNKVIRNCSLYFSHCLPGSTLLLLDFIHAVNRVRTSSQTQAPRVEAQTILGSTLFFCNIYRNLPVLNPGNPDPTPEICRNLKDHMIESLLHSCKTESVPAARCVALSSAGLWLYEELTSGHEVHPKVKEAINLLLLSLKHKSPPVASAACFQLRLFTQCTDDILKILPDVAPRVLEVISLTIITTLHNHEEKKSEDAIAQLIVNLLLCILDWCMSVPLETLHESITLGGRNLLKLIIKAVETASQGRVNLAKTRHSMANIAVQESESPGHPPHVLDSPPTVSKAKTLMHKNPTKKNETTNTSMKLAANLVLQHLTNHLGQFPLAKGASVLSSLVCENHDLKNCTMEMTPELFNSPEVQFFTCDDTCLISIVETSARKEECPNDSSFRMRSADRCVRFIVRHPGGKFCWDCFSLFGPSNIEALTEPVKCDLPPGFDELVCQPPNDFARSCDVYDNVNCVVSPNLSNVPLPTAEDALFDSSADKLDQLLHHLGSTSRECRIKPDLPLNVPAPSPSLLSGTTLESDVFNCMLRHHQSLSRASTEQRSTRHFQNGSDHSLSERTSEKVFHYARLFCKEFGFLSRHSRQKIHLLAKNERLLRELKNLDSRNCRETHKVAVIYIANGQEDKASILSNTGGSKDYEDFVAGLGWEVNLATHKGFRGKLPRDGSTGQSCPYYATSVLEVIFHVATRFPPDDTAINVKIRHLGNDEVHIVWSEHHRDYRHGIIPTEFGDVLIVIYPIKHRLYRIQIMKKQEIPYFGPLFDGAVVNGRVLPVLVRETAINAGRAKRSLINLYQPFYEERTRYLHQIVSQFKEKNTFEEYCAGLFRPAPLKRKKKDRSDPSRDALPRASPESTHRHNTNNSSLSGFSRRFSNPNPTPRSTSTTLVDSATDVDNVGISDAANSVCNVQSQNAGYMQPSSSYPPPKCSDLSVPHVRLERIVSEHANATDAAEQS